MKKILTTLVLCLPVVTLAQNNSNGVDGLIKTFGGWIAALTPIAFAAAVLFFFYGLAMFILKSGDDQEKGKNTMIWGVVAIFVMASVFGLVNFLQATFNIDKSDTISVPSVNGVE